MTRLNTANNAIYTFYKCLQISVKRYKYGLLCTTATSKWVWIIDTQPSVLCSISTVRQKYPVLQLTWWCQCG